MATDISEAGLEKIISDYLVDVNGYELGKAAEFNKEYALDEGRSHTARKGESRTYSG